MKERTERSPGRRPRKGKAQPGLLTATSIEFEAAADFRHFLASFSDSGSATAYWDGQCARFEAFARQFTRQEAIRGGLTAEGKAAEVLWWAGCLRGHMERGGKASDVAHAAMRLAAAMVELVLLTHEEALLVGYDAMARPQAMRPAQPSRGEEWARWRDEARKIRDEQPRLLSAKRTAEIIKNRLGLDDSVSTIRRRIAEP